VLPVAATFQLNGWLDCFMPDGIRLPMPQAGKDSI